jgi:hypothetical protein
MPAPRTITARLGAELLPLPACGERVGVRGSGTFQAQRKVLPLTLTLSPLRFAAWGEGTRRALAPRASNNTRSPS